MSTANKPKGGQASELTKLKQLPPEKHEVIWSWRNEVPALTNAQIRNKLAATYGVRLALDKQLSQFWSWYQQQQDLQDTNDLLESFEEFCREKNPDWNEEKVRSAGIQFFMANAVTRKDADQFANIVKLDQKERFGKAKGSLEERRLALDQSKFLIESDRFLESLLKKAAELNASGLSHADKIAEMRKAAFQSVDELQASGKVVIPKS